MFSASGGLSMRGIGRLVTAVLLTGAVVGAAAFAHLSGSVPGSTFFGEPAALPATAGTGAPLVIRAAPLPVPPRAQVPHVLLRRAALIVRPAAPRLVVHAQVVPAATHQIHPDQPVVVAAAAPPPV